MKDFNIRFREMSDDEFDKYYECSISSYSQDLIKSGLCSQENAFDSAKKQFSELLPQGKYTKNNFIYEVVNSENEDVGLIWYEKYSESVAYICDFLILEKFRKQGYGKQTLLLVEDEVKNNGFNKIGFNVFKYNKPAFSLYKCLGYKIFKEDSGNMIMIKDI